MNAGEALVFKVVIDDTGVASTAANTGKAIQNMAAAATAGQRQFAALGASAAQTSNAMRQLPAQFTDIATQLAGGQSPFLILLQQGGQIKDSFGGVGNAFKALGSLITPVRVAIGGVAAVFAAAGLAAYEGFKQTQEFNRSLQLTGNYAGQTLDSLNALSYGVAQSSGVTIGAAREIAAALVSTGSVGPKAIGAVTAAASTLAKITGQSAADVAKDFASMSGGVAKWALEHNRAYNYLNVEQYKYIRQLEAQGEYEEAMRVNAELLDKKLKDRAVDLGLLETGWRKVKEIASEAWDSMLNIGRSQSPGDAVAALRAQLTLQQEALAFAKDGRGSKAEIEGRQRVIDKLSAEIERTRELARLKNQSAAAEAANAQRNQDDLVRASKGYQDLLLNQERQGLNLRAAQNDFAREREALADKRSFDSLEITGVTYMQRRIARERAALDAKEGLVNAEIELEKRRVSESISDQPVREAKLLELETKRVAIGIERLKLDDKIRRGELYTAPPVAIRDRQDFLQFERKAQAEAERETEQRNQRAAAAISDLVQTNRSGAISLIKDDKARGQAQIALDEETIRNRLELFSMSVSDRQMAEDALAQWRVQREAQLTDELKPEWQRQLEAWQDTTRLMRDSFNEFQTGWLREGEDAWVSFFQTGKANVSNLVNFMIAEFARLQFRQMASSGFSGLGQALAGFLGIGGGGSNVNYSNEGLNYPAPIVASALGNVFGRGGIEAAFASGGIFGAGGGVLNRPTLFRMANGGTGLAGEAGPESVMPLRRTADGRLGVISQGGSAGPIAFNVQVNTLPGQTAEVTKQQNSSGGIDAIVKITQAKFNEDMAQGGPMSRAIASRFGVSRAAGAPNIS